ncbi:hypothetical protein HDU81_002788 [Chytriomyces hyalinus]|nr:hypothetical protein HDU81_002788 [Chytriomyces hyalinus]
MANKETEPAALKRDRHALKVTRLSRNYSLDSLYTYRKVQPHIGTEFDQGYVIGFAFNMSRNVVFLRNQDITFDEQKEFIDRLGRAAGKPASSGLHRHPVSESSSEFGQEAYIISSDLDKRNSAYVRSELHSTQWHSE